MLSGKPLHVCICIVYNRIWRHDWKPFETTQGGPPRVSSVSLSPQSMRSWQASVPDFSTWRLVTQYSAADVSLFFMAVSKNYWLVLGALTGRIIVRVLGSV